MDLGLEGRTVLVTGAARGLGRAMVDAFHAAGAEVIGFDIRQESLEEVARECGIRVIQGDVRVPEDVDRAIAEAGRIDVLCNNAGIIDRLGAVDEVDSSEWDDCIAINLTGSFLFCRGVVPSMLERQQGVIVNVASIGGLRGGRGGAAYTASKFGLVGLTMNIAATYGADGIRCNAICPGAMHTSIREGLTLMPSFERLLRRNAERAAPSDPRTVASVAVFLASDAAAQINGVAVPVDNGDTAY